MSTEIIQARLKQVEDSHDLDESLKAKIRDYYQQALRELDSAQTWLAGAARFEQMAASAPADLAATKAELDKLPAKPSSETADDIALPQIDQLISKKQSELDEHRAAIGRIGGRTQAPRKPPRGYTQVVQCRQGTVCPIGRTTPGPRPGRRAGPLTGPRRALLLCQRKATECEIQAFDKEIAAYEATAELLPVRRDLSARSVSLAEQEIKALAGSGQSPPPDRGGKAGAGRPARRRPGASRRQTPGPRKRRPRRNRARNSSSAGPTPPANWKQPNSS